MKALRRFLAKTGGRRLGHDDTPATMQTLLDGVPAGILCAHAKTRTEGAVSKDALNPNTRRFHHG